MIGIAFFVVTALAGRLGAAQGLGTDEPGQLEIVGRAVGQESFCPLKHTSVNADIAGFGARVNVIQSFTNPSTTPVEAVYTFPLPHDAAVDRMRIKVGDRVIEGQIKRREEARRIYEAAKNAGQTAGLLDQERPNIFTQSVANIMPGAVVKVEISYVQILKYENGQFEYVFPMVVGPRYLGNTRDPEKVWAPITAPGTRTGSTIDLTVHLDAGAPIESLNSVLHKVSLNREDDRHTTITLMKENEIPNRDFILRYQTCTNSVQSAFVTSYDAKNGGFFDLLLLPPKQPRPADITPREMIFVVDTSGSQNGFPLAKSKELTYKLLNTMRPGDTFNVYNFNTQSQSLWNKPRPYTSQTLGEAHRFLDPLRAGGGTDILGVLRSVLTAPKDLERLRIVLFNTDGFVGDEPAILPEIKKDLGDSRIFAFGIGNSVNRYLIDAMGHEGKGDSEVVTLAESANPAVDRFEQRLRTPVLTDIQAEAKGIELTDMVPSDIPDVFSDRPIVIQGRYENPGHGRLLLTGRVGTKAWSQTLNLNFSADSGDSCVATLWARKKLDDLNDQSFQQQMLQDGTSVLDYKSKIVDVALQFGIMSEYTSFVAVEPRVVNVGGVLRTVHVPVEMADGVSYKGIYGNGVALQDRLQMSFAASSNATTLSPPGGGGGFGGGGASGGRMATRSAGTTLGLSGSNRLQDGSVSDQPHTFENVVDKRLRSLRGQIAVMIYLTKADVETIAKLKTLGVTIDENDKKLMLVIGTCDATVLKKLAAMMEVERITPVE